MSATGTAAASITPVPARWPRTTSFSGPADKREQDQPDSDGGQSQPFVAAQPGSHDGDDSGGDADAGRDDRLDDEEWLAELQGENRSDETDPVQGDADEVRELTEQPDQQARVEALRRFGTPGGQRLQDGGGAVTQRREDGAEQTDHHRRTLTSCEGQAGSPPLKVVGQQVDCLIARVELTPRPTASR